MLQPACRYLATLFLRFEKAPSSVGFSALSIFMIGPVVAGVLTAWMTGTPSDAFAMFAGVLLALLVFMHVPHRMATWGGMMHVPDAVTAACIRHAAGGSLPALERLRESFVRVSRVPNSTLLRVLGDDALPLGRVLRAYARSRVGWLA